MGLDFGSIYYIHYVRASYPYPWTNTLPEDKCAAWLMDSVCWCESSLFHQSTRAYRSIAGVVQLSFGTARQIKISGHVYRWQIEHWAQDRRFAGRNVAYCLYCTGSATRQSITAFWFIFCTYFIECNSFCKPRRVNRKCLSWLIKISRKAGFRAESFRRSCHLVSQLCKAFLVKRLSIKISHRNACEIKQNIQTQWANHSLFIWQEEKKQHLKYGRSEINVGDIFEVVYFLSLTQSRMSCVHKQPETNSFLLKNHFNLCHSQDLFLRIKNPSEILLTDKFDAAAFMQRDCFHNYQRINSWTEWITGQSHLSSPLPVFLENVFRLARDQVLSTVVLRLTGWGSLNCLFLEAGTIFQCLVNKLF